MLPYGGETVFPYNRPEGDQPNAGERRQQAQAQHENITERLELIRVHARIDHVEEDGRRLHQTRKRVLNGTVRWMKLCREVVVRNIRVSR